MTSAQRKSTIVAAIKEWANCRSATIDGDGAVWIANPQAGHWLTMPEWDALYDWCVSRNVIASGDRLRP